MWENVHFLRLQTVVLCDFSKGSDKIPSNWNRTRHNCLKTQKVNTFPHSLMEHTVFFMYIHGIYVKKLKKKEFEFFFGSIGIRTRIAQGIADMLDLREILL